jgi:hypothetical protein
MGIKSAFAALPTMFQGLIALAIIAVILSTIFIGSYIVRDMCPMLAEGIANIEEGDILGQGAKLLTNLFCAQIPI